MVQNGKCVATNLEDFTRCKKLQGTDQVWVQKYSQSAQGSVCVRGQGPELLRFLDSLILLNQVAPYFPPHCCYDFLLGVLVSHVLLKLLLISGEFPFLGGFQLLGILEFRAPGLPCTALCLCGGNCEH